MQTPVEEGAAGTAGGGQGVNSPLPEDSVHTSVPLTGTIADEPISIPRMETSAFLEKIERKLNIDAREYSYDME